MGWLNASLKATEKGDELSTSLYLQGKEKILISHCPDRRDSTVCKSLRLCDKLTATFK